MAMTIKLYKLPKQTTADFRPAEPRDVPQITALLHQKLSQYRVHLIYSEEEVAHKMLPRKGVIYSYVHEVDGKVTDFFSFYSQPYKLLNNLLHSHIWVAESYQYFNYSMPAHELMQNALIIAQREGFDSYNCGQKMQADQFIEHNLFKRGSLILRYYLYNWNIGEIVDNKDLGVTFLA